MTTKEMPPLLLDIKCYFFPGNKERLYAAGINIPVLHPEYVLGWRRLKACNLRIDFDWEVFHRGDFYIAVFDMGNVDSPPMFILRKEIPSLKHHIEISRPKTVFTL